MSDSDRLSVLALNDITLSLTSGDRLGVIGHNGAGKTTLLRLIAGVYEPVAGTIRCHGRVAGLYDLTLGMDMEATGLENIVIRGMLLGLSRDQINAKMNEIIAFTELGDYIRLPVKTYSSGMLLRLGFAISTATDADILLMDEWVSVGDQAFQKKAEQRLKDLVNRTRILVLTSHSLSLIEETCNLCLWLDRGQVRDFGSAQAVMARYRSQADS